MQVSEQLHDRAASSQRRSLKYPLDRRLDGSQIRSRHCGEESKLTLPVIEAGPSSFVARRDIDFSSSDFNNDKLSLRLIKRPKTYGTLEVLLIVETRGHGRGLSRNTALDFYLGSIEFETQPN
jgi:hypothetical protein